jgi:hypothetical protein
MVNRWVYDPERGTNPQESDVVLRNGYKITKPVEAAATLVLNTGCCLFMI